jgi:hypothetical protein
VAVRALAASPKHGARDVGTAERLWFAFAAARGQPLVWSPTAFAANPLAVEEELLAFFLVNVERGVAPDTAANYVSRIATHLSRAVGQPVRGDGRMPVLAGVVRAARSIPRTRQYKLPVSAAVVQSILRDTAVDPGVRAAIAAAFACCLRVGECTVAPGTRRAPLVRAGVRFRSVPSRSPSGQVRVMFLHVLSSKADAFNVGEDAFAAVGSALAAAPRSASHIDPVVFVEEYVARFPAAPDAPAFLLQSGAPVSPAAVRATIKAAVAACGLDPARYSSHSIRIGAAVAMADAGVDVATIKAVGRWKSATFLRYLRMTSDRLVAVADAIARAPANIVMGGRSRVPGAAVTGAALR